MPIVLTENGVVPRMYLDVVSYSCPFQAPSMKVDWLQDGAHDLVVFVGDVQSLRPSRADWFLVRYI
jgi:hypothetical protein